MDKNITVRMFGGFSIECGEAVVSDGSSRSRKVWMLLAYLVYNRDRALSQDELIELLWGEAGPGGDPRGALKAVLFRVRSALDGLWKGAGHDLIINRSGSYMWNSEYPVTSDTGEFERLVKEAESCDDADRTLCLYQQAIELYRGSFLPGMSAESWAIPVEAYYSRLASGTVLTTLQLLSERDLTDSVCRIASNALNYDPYNEEIYFYYMSALLSSGNRKAAVAAYENLKKLLTGAFGTGPSEKLLKLYREASRTINGRAVSADVIRDQLREKTLIRGALICEYDYFQVLYHSAARSIKRTGEEIHIGIFTLKGSGGSELAKRSLDRAMENLQEQIRINLRIGDSATRCSASQYVIMLHNCGYEDSRKVCDRIQTAFYRQYPHTPANITYLVRPLEPMP